MCVALDYFSGRLSTSYGDWQFVLKLVVHWTRVETCTGYPLLKQGKKEKWPKKFLSGKTEGIWKFSQNTGKIQGIWFAQVLNSLILKVKDISIFAAK